MDACLLACSCSLVPAKQKETEALKTQDEKQQKIEELAKELEKVEKEKLADIAKLKLEVRAQCQVPPPPPGVREALRLPDLREALGPSDLHEPFGFLAVRERRVSTLMSSCLLSVRGEAAEDAETDGTDAQRAEQSARDLQTGECCVGIPPGTHGHTHWYPAVTTSCSKLSS